VFVYTLLVKQCQTFVECSILVTEERFSKFFRVHKTYSTQNGNFSCFFYAGGNKHMVRVLENRLLRKIFGPERLEET